MTTVLSGPARALGQGMKAGVEAYFSEINAQGGVNGRPLELIAIDDGYEPSKAAPNMRKLIDEHKVISVVGNVGTPTAIVTVPIANEEKTLLFGAFTGAGVLRQTPPDRYIINYRASYAEETAAMIKGLLSAGIKPEEIAFFTQNDGYGDAGYKGAIRALKSMGFSDTEKLAHGRYTRNTLNVEEALSIILDAKVEPRAVIMVGAYAPCAAFIKLAREDFPDTLFLNVSFVGSVALAKALGKIGEGVIVTQVVPDFKSKHPGVVAYRQAMKKYAPDMAPGFVSLEGYIVARIFVEGLKKAKPELTRESVIDGLLSISKLDVGIGETLRYSAREHQGSHKVWPTIIRAGKYVPFDWADLKK
ncbi:MAG TPA: ligand-binding receptor [Gammaproteobacteria bacterium]|nr:ligand-binding receptor [Gammaproteobacteria bacterium]